MAEEPQSSPAPLSGHAPSEPTGALLWTLALTLSVYVIAYPFTLVRYPPITALPLHAAAVSIFRHYFDPAFHFREQLTLHPLEAPALSLYAFGAMFALVVPVATATKLSAMTMLALVPAGLSVLSLGMRKNPLWGLLGLSLTWCTATQSGFFAAVGAVGLFAMSIGLALLVVRRPTRVRRIALGLALLAIFFTQIYRLPFAIVGVLVAGALASPATKRFSPLVLPLVPALVVFSLWLIATPHGMSALRGVAFHPERLHELGSDFFGSYLPLNGTPTTPESTLERALAKRTLALGLFAIVAAGALFFVDGRGKDRTPDEVSWAVAVTALPLILSAGLLVSFLTLPSGLGAMCCEVVPLALFAMSAAPDLPRAILPRLAFVLVFAMGALPMSRFVSARFHEFESATEDFRAVVAETPPAPRLGAVVDWLGEPRTRVSPFAHLPAWIQAEKGGVLDAHFVRTSPNGRLIQYRTGSPGAAPERQGGPSAPDGAGQGFRVTEEGWLDTFVVRRLVEPRELFDADPTIRLTAHHGTWWLYQRTR